MKPEFTKPFDLAHAKAGAPYSFSDGESAEIIAWSRSGAMSLVSMKGPHQSLTLSRADGTSGGMATLVMTPLGMIAGKPVFTGDMLVYARKSTEFAAMAQHRQCDFDAGIGCTWPAPAKVYPQTLMADSELSDAWHSASKTYPACLREFANSIMHHEIESGQVVIAADRDARDMTIARAACEFCACDPVDQLLRSFIATVPK